MSQPTPFIHRNLPRLLLEAREAVMQHTRPSLREHGLSDQQWLTRMERDGLIRRERCSQDARRTVVRATRAGLELVRNLSTTIEAHYAWMEERLGEAQLSQLYALLDSVIVLEQPIDIEESEAPE